MPLSQEESRKLKKTATAASVALAVSLSLLKMFGALYTGSLAVLSSMIDSLADIFASSVTFIAVKISSSRPIPITVTVMAKPRPFRRLFSRLLSPVPAFLSCMTASAALLRR